MVQERSPGGRTQLAGYCILFDVEGVVDRVLMTLWINVHRFSLCLLVSGVAATRLRPHVSGSTFRRLGKPRPRAALRHPFLGTFWLNLASQ